MQISAKENIGVQDVFDTLLREIVGVNPCAGSGEGSGSVMGAGQTPATGGEAGAAKGAGKKKKKCVIM